VDGKFPVAQAHDFILGGAELIATHPDDLCPTEDSYDVDIGPFIRLFESLADVKANVIGKPNRIMLDMAASAMGIPAENVAMVGDRLYTDIKMAADAGTPSVLVLSGETKREDLECSCVRPTYVVDSVADIPSLDIDI
jgi:ribonucleotide monophosphatase NagD (HAD superfamily)